MDEISLILDNNHPMFSRALEIVRENREKPVKEIALYLRNVIGMWASGNSLPGAASVAEKKSLEHGLQLIRRLKADEQSVYWKGLARHFLQRIEEGN